MKKYAVLSSTPSLLYASFLPITTLFWKSVGYDVITLLAFDHRWADPSFHLVVGSLLYTGSKIYYVDSVPGFKLSTVAQVSRLAAAALPVTEESYFLTGDADMLPLSPTWFNSGDPTATFHVFNSDAYKAYQQSPTHFPICYLGGKRDAWRELMGLSTESLDMAVSSLCQGEVDHWGLDEELVRNKFAAWPKLGQCQLIERGYAPGTCYARDRLDRGNWVLPANLSTLIDCHSARPLQHAWTLLRKLVDHFLPADSAKFVYDYVSDLTLLTDGAH